MTKEERLKDYTHYRKLIHENKTEERPPAEVTKDLNFMLDNNLNEIIMGFLYNRLEKNKTGEMNRQKTPFSFLVQEKELIKGLSDISLLTRLKDKIQEKITEHISFLPILSPETVKQSKVFKYEVLYENYSNSLLNYLIFFDVEDLGVVESYKEIYKSHLLQELSLLYYKPNINRQINPDRFQMASEDNFKEEFALQEIPLTNTNKLATRFINSVKEGRKIIIEDEIILCYKVLAAQNAIWLSKQVESGIEVTPVKSSTAIQDVEESVRRSITHVLRGSVKQDEYAAFFTQDDYINFVQKKHPKVSRERVEAIFKSITWPKPPAGVTRFTIPASKEHKAIIYFVSLEHVPMIFLKLGMDKKKFDMTTHMPERHFFLFLKKLFGDFVSRGYTNEKIASMIHCSATMVDDMKKSVAKYNT